MNVYIEKHKAFERYEVESLRFDRNSHFLKLRGIDSLGQADSLAGLDVYVPEENMVPLEEGNYYHFQIIGSEVLTKDGTTIGVVKGLMSVGESSLLVVARAGAEALIPFTKVLCPVVDPGKRQIRVDLPDGLLDLNEI